MGRVAFYDLVEQIAASRHGVPTFPTALDMAHDPGTLPGIFSLLELLDEEREHTGKVGVFGTDEGKGVALEGEV